VNVHQIVSNLLDSAQEERHEGRKVTRSVYSRMPEATGSRQITIIFTNSRLSDMQGVKVSFFKLTLFMRVSDASYLLI